MRIFIPRLCFYFNNMLDTFYGFPLSSLKIHSSVPRSSASKLDVSDNIFGKYSISHRELIRHDCFGSHCLWYPVCGQSISANDKFNLCKISHLSTTIQSRTNFVTNNPSPFFCKVRQKSFLNRNIHLNQVAFAATALWLGSSQTAVTAVWEFPFQVRSFGLFHILLKDWGCLRKQQ